MSDMPPASAMIPPDAEEAELGRPGAPSDGVRPSPPIVVGAAAPNGGVSPFAGHDRPVGTEPLARIEDKTSRIEEKLARSEAAMQRVVDRFELASTRMGEVASQADLLAVRGEVAFIARRIRKVPGATALAATAVATAILTAVVVLLMIRFVPGLLPSR